MAEPNYQSPHYSIMYGFREGAQHDIFENTNPRRHITSSVVKEEPPRCDDNTSSRLSDSDAEKASWVLKSSNCMCTAELDAGVLKISLSNNDTESDIPTLSPTLYPLYVNVKGIVIRMMKMTGLMRMMKMTGLVLLGKRRPAFPALKQKWV